EGDPGWDHGKADPALKIDYQRDWYHAPRTTLQCGEVAAGRKCVRFRAEQVHHFAFSLNPDYVYEQGRYGDAVVRVLYQPGDRATWGQGIAVRNTVLALAWLDSLFGKYQWPQLTNVHRIEGGGTEFPMMIMDGSASLGLIVHETGHQYTMGQLANNEWREGWLDEGFSDFQEGGFFETHGGPAAYDGREPSVLWLDPTPLIDSRQRRVERQRLADGRWRTGVTVERKGDGRMPVEIGDRDTIYARATGEPATERVEFTPARKPGRLVLDPRGRTHD